jgi:DNA-binding CsgD family transcriptional regulator
MAEKREKSPDGTVSPLPLDGARAWLEQGRAAYRARAWNDAFEALSRAHGLEPLAAPDLELLAWSAGLTGRNDDLFALSEQLYALLLENGENIGAARWAFWTGFRLLGMRELARANGWLSRAERLLAREPGSVVEGYMLLPVVRRHYYARAYDEALATAQHAARIAEQHQDLDLSMFARNLQGRALLRLGRVEEGLPLLDEAMVAASAGSLSPLITGLLYCSAIDSYHCVYAIDRAREWNGALFRWCEAQPQLVTFTGACLVQRAELLELAGDWDEAREEARRVAARATAPAGNEGANQALYRLGELYRLRGELVLAEEAFRAASQLGVEPQPGLALLRLAQGKREQALTSLRRLVSSEQDPLERLRFLPAYIEILLARSEPTPSAADPSSGEEVERAVADLAAIAARFAAPMIAALAADARARLRLCQGDAEGALSDLRRAFQTWQEIGAPYLAARTRVALCRAYRALGDRDAAELEQQAAQVAFEKLGAASDLRALGALREGQQGAPAHRLTPRELAVLRLLSAGMTNKAMAAQLHLSEKTIDRHVSNIFMKIGVATRAAATAFAYEHKLVSC